MATNHSAGGGRGRKPLWWSIHAGCDSGMPFAASVPSLMSTSHEFSGATTDYEHLAVVVF